MTFPNPFSKLRSTKDEPAQSTPPDAELKDAFSSQIPELSQFYEDLTEARTETQNPDTFESLVPVDEIGALLGPSGFERYESKEQIDVGGMKSILKVRDKSSGREVALAVMRNPDQVTMDQVERFVRGARITANLQHPNIVPVHDVGLDDEGKPYFTMKLLSGESLAAIIRKIRKKEPEAKRFDPFSLLDIFTKICDAISYAHSRRTIHLDLKPENIQVSDFGEVLVLDWGLARIIGGVEDEEEEAWVRQITETVLEQTMDGHVKGTPGYMSPEQADGSNTDRDERSDVFALGAILYTLLTLQRPGGNRSPEAILRETTDGTLITEASFSKKRKVPVALQAVVLKAVARKPEDRYQSVTALSNDVRAYVSGFSTLAEEAGVLRKFFLLVNRNKVVSTAILAGLAVVTAFVIKLSDSEQRARQRLQDYEQEYKKREEEQRKRSEISHLAAMEYVNNVPELLEEMKFTEANDVLNTALLLDATITQARLLSGHLYLSQMAFASAMVQYSQDPSEEGLSMSNLAREYHQAQIDDMLPEAGFLQLVADMKRMGVPDPFRYYLFMNRYAVEPSLPQKLDLCRQALSRLNDSLGMFIYDAETNTMNLQGNNKLDDLAPLAGLPIEAIDLSDSRVKDLKALATLPLKRINLANTSIESLEDLEGLKPIELNLQGTWVNRFYPLDMSQVRILNIADTSIKSLDPLRGRNVEDLDIRHCLLEDFLALLDLPKLRRLVISTNMLTDGKQTVIDYLESEKNVEVVVE